MMVAMVMHPMPVMMAVCRFGGQHGEETKNRRGENSSHRSPLDLVKNSRRERAGWRAAKARNARERAIASGEKQNQLG
jgi:hypothetical protein